MTFLSMVKSALKTLKDFFPYITSFALFYLNIRQNNKAEKTAALKERLTEFYIPFFSYYCAGMLYKTKFSSLSNDNREKFIVLFAENLHYMGTKSQILYFNFFSLIRDFNDAPQDPSVAKQYNSAFYALANQILAEYVHIARKLKMPKPAIPNCSFSYMCKKPKHK